MKRCFSVTVLACLILSALIGCGETATQEVEPVTAPVHTEMPEADNRIIITEFMEKNKAVLRDRDGDFSDWIELYNRSDSAVSLKGWSLSDKPNKQGWTFPDVSIDAGEYLIVFASKKDSSDTELHTGFALGGDEDVFLYDANGLSVDRAPCGGCVGDVSMALIDGEWQPSKYPTPGYENSDDGYECFQSTLEPVGQLIISEVVVFNNEGLDTVITGHSDWVELKNISDSPVSLSEYWLSDDDDDYLMWPLPDMVLDAGSSAVFICDSTKDEEDYAAGWWFTGFSLDADEEQLYLYKSGEGLADYVSLRDIPYECSFGRADGEAGWFFFDTPTPEASNGEGRRLISAAPEALTEDGVFNGLKSVTAELSGSGEIRYTLDGSMPTRESELYTRPLRITQTCVLRAVSFEDDKLPSHPLNLSYIINEHHTLPVFSLVTDDPVGFSQMYDSMAKYIEQPGALSVYLPDGSFTVGCGVSLNGETSLVLPKKNMSLRFRTAYGNSTLSYDIYGGGVTEFTNLLLRSGQDYEHAIIRNELAQSLCEAAEMNVINQRSIYGVLYINGEYRGIYSLKEKANEQLYASLAGVDRDSVEMYEAAVPYQSSFFQDVIHFVLFNDMTQPQNYQYFCSVVDVDSLIDWLIIEGFCANTDVTSGNLRYARSPEADGKWHFFFYDLDASFTDEGSMFYNLMTDYGSENIQASSYIVPLMENAQFRDSFLTRAAELLRDKLTNDAVLAELDRLVALVEPEVARDYGRFTMETESWEYNVDRLREMISEDNWRQLNIEALCFVFDLDDAERAHYFGEIDGK